MSDAVTPPRPVPVADRLPTAAGTYLVWRGPEATGEGVWDTCLFMPEDGFRDDARWAPIRYWMPWPDPPVGCRARERARVKPWRRGET